MNGAARIYVCSGSWPCESAAARRTRLCRRVGAVHSIKLIWATSQASQRTSTHSEIFDARCSPFRRWLSTIPANPVVGSNALRVASDFHLRQRRDSDTHRTIGFGDHAQSLGVELDVREAQVDDRSVNANAGGTLAELSNRRLDTLARIRRERH